jgi:hypothetical protein
MYRQLLLVPGLAVFLVSAAVGCGSGSGVHQVSGKVTLDNEPLPDGDITFFPEAKDAAPEGGKIKDGQYKLNKVKSGKNKVVIQARRLVPGKTGPMGEPATEDYIPARYGDKEKTELSVDVSDGKTEHSFPLKSK